MAGCNPETPSGEGDGGFVLVRLKELDVAVHEENAAPRLVVPAQRFIDHDVSRKALVGMAFDVDIAARGTALVAGTFQDFWLR